MKPELPSDGSQEPIKHKFTIFGNIDTGLSVKTILWEPNPWSAAQWNTIQPLF